MIHDLAGRYDGRAEKALMRELECFLGDEIAYISKLSNTLWVICLNI